MDKKFFADLMKKYCHLYLNAFKNDLFSLKHKQIECLSVDEVKRFEKQIVPKKRDQMICARIFLRETLANYLNLCPSEIHFIYGQHGKPMVIGEQNQVGLHFNMSHSDQNILIGVSLEGPIGVDIESINPKLDYMSLAKRFYALSEVELLKRSPHPRLLFYRLWTAKEARVKALGVGLMDGLDAVVFECEDDQIMASQPGWYLHEGMLDKAEVFTIASQSKIHPVTWMTT